MIVREIVSKYKIIEKGSASELTIDSPEKVWEFLRDKIADSIQEEFVVLILNNKNRLTYFQRVSMGTLNETIVHPRDVFRSAIRENGAGVIVAHNHPSGGLLPSKEDTTTTKRLIEAGKILGISVHDSIIVSSSGYLSLKEEGYLN